MRQGSKARKEPTAGELVEAMRQGGAVFFFSDCGSLFVRGLASLPAELTARFFDGDPRAIVAAVRSTTAPAEQERRAA